MFSEIRVNTPLCFLVHLPCVIHKYHKGNHIGVETKMIFQRVATLSQILSKIEGKSKRCKNLTIFILLGLHLIISLCQKDFTWFASFGGLLTTLGLLLIFSQNSLQEHHQDFNDLHSDEVPAYIVEGGMPLGNVVMPDQVEKVLKQRKDRYTKKYQNLSYYFWCTVLGTIIWSYAGFLNFLWD